MVLVCLFLNPATVLAEATLYVSPEAGVYTIGEIFDIKVLADTGGQKINAAEAELTFNPGALEVQKIITEDSILESWPTPPSFSNEKGTMRFSGWTKNNFSGPSGLLVTIRFKALHNMSSNAYLAAGAILSADGQGSNIITSMKSGLYSVEPKHVDATQEPSDVAIVGEQISGTTTDDALQLTHTGSSLEIPTFEKDSIVINVGERIVINGTGAPNSKILFFLSKGENSEKYSAVTSDSDGSFTFIFTFKLPTLPEKYRAKSVYHIHEIRAKLYKSGA